jgi:D-alanyl-D-alanine carboxypeptidase
MGLGGDHQHAVFGEQAARQGFHAALQKIRQSRCQDIETQFNGGRYLVDVLPARAGGADKVFLDIGGVQDYRIGDPDHGPLKASFRLTAQGCWPYRSGLARSRAVPLWWNGRRGGLKIRFREEWGFKSLQGHHICLPCFRRAEPSWSWFNGVEADRNPVIRLIATFFVLLTVLSSARADEASVGPSLLFDAQTGELISQDRAGEPWYPASLTKLMTAYVVFEKIRDGKLRLDQHIPVSALANAQEASKIGVPVGQTVSVDFALQALLVYSANDMAYVLAEGASGSVGQFSDDMNANAKRIGLSASHFVNPNGLFDPRHVTSARDIGIVAALIIHEFPQYQRYFDQEFVQVGKRRLSNRNSLIRSMPEADGMKTGFVCNSGFNLVASATRNGRRLIAVVLGTKSGYARAQLAQLMLESGFARPATANKIKVAEIRNIDMQPGIVTDMTEKVCPRKSPVLYANSDKFHGWSVALGFYDKASDADRVLREKLLAARGQELSGAGGVVEMPGKGKFAAMVWGLDESEGETYCELVQATDQTCRVYAPAFLASLATQKELDRPKPAVAQGSDALRKSSVTVKIRTKVKPARRVKKLLRARRKS